MDKFYDYNNNLVFDEPVEYKGIKIYPITIKYYQLVKLASEIFSIDQTDETDVELAGLPYMEYLLKKAAKYPEFQELYGIFNSIISLSLGKQLHSFRYEGEFLKFIVAIPTENYNEETMCVYKEKLNQYSELAKDGFHKLLNKIQIENLNEEIEELANRLFTISSFEDKDYEKIIDIICQINDIDNRKINRLWKKELDEAQAIINEINGKDTPQFEDLVNVVALYLKKLPNEIKDMTLRRFDRYMELILDKENYTLCKQAEFNGCELKQSPKHWLKHYIPKGRYSGLENNGAGMEEVFNNK